MGQFGPKFSFHATNSPKPLGKDSGIVKLVALSEKASSNAGERAPYRDSHGTETNHALRHKQTPRVPALASGSGGSET
ncbi:hypothetical protein SLEP1_g43717 [Rubroshorea leprosula]|uniref:Uncharacterized protein n=1 Tax=Rubroshorea leprosula TaxID=152421 RepID=A0AAV5LEW0_9ROSI|nr:hypothetical protein SLEP1_g43717 [Rubroshorea leprosula]